MAVTADSWQRAILQEIGAYLGDHDCGLRRRITDIWELWEGKGETSLHLQYLYAKRQAIDYLLGSLRTQIDTELGPLKKRCKQIFDNLLELRKLITADIAEEDEHSGGTLAIGELTTTSPIMPEEGHLDPHSRYYRGDPLARY